MTRVQFRIDKAKREREVTAIFPDLLERPGYETCYAHIGQHSACSRQWVVSRTRPATPEEYAPLLAELVAIGYDDLKIIQRAAR